MDSYAYPYEDFIRDFDAINPLLDPTRPDANKFANDILDYIEAKYPEDLDQQKRYMALCKAFYFLNKHRTELDVGSFAIVGQSQTLVSEHLLRAVHALICFATIHGRPMPKPGEVVTFAERLAKDNNTQITHLKSN